MSSGRNLGDPSYEPTDEELVSLSHLAFAEVKQEHERALQVMRLQIQQGQARARLALTEKK